MNKRKSKLQIAQERTEKALARTNQKIEELGDKTLALYKALDSVQKSFDAIRNVPHEEQLEYAELRTIRNNWKREAQKIEDDYKRSKVEHAGFGAAGVGAGIAVVSLGPAAAMGVATTFGVASTGTAISTLSGAAATNAALAWLGGGALAAGGGGIAAGSAFLALAGPIGWCVAGVALLGSGYLFLKTAREKSRLEDIYTLISERDIRSYDLATAELTERIKRIVDETGKLLKAVAIIRTFGLDYSKMTEHQQMQLAAYLHLMNGSTQLLVNPILGLQPKYTEKDLQRFCTEARGKNTHLLAKHRNAAISMCNMFYHIYLKYDDRKLMWNSLKENKDLLRSLHMSKKEFTLPWVESVFDALKYQSHLENEEGRRESSSGYDEFAQFLLEQYMDDNPDKNIVNSPFATLTMMNILSEISAGETKEQIIHALNKTVSPAAYQEIKDMLGHSNALCLANLILLDSKIRKSVTLETEAAFHKQFDGKIYSAEKASDTANKWVSQKTRGMVTKAVTPYLERLPFSILSAAAFEAKWDQQYWDSNVINKDFTNFDKSVSRVKMLESTELTYLESRDYRGFMKPYIGKEFSFAAFIPKSKKYELTQTDAKAINFAEYRRRDDAEVSLTMPEFKIEITQDLTSAYRKLGIQDIFDGRADFSNLSKDCPKIDAIMQKATIEVSREGTKAVAIEGGLAGSACFDLDRRQTIILDRPFLYAIVHNRTGVPVYTGVVRYLEEIPDGQDRLTVDEKIKILRPLYKKICKQLDVFDEDGIVDVLPESPEEKFYKRAKTAFYSRNVKEMERVAKEVEVYVNMRKG